MQAIACLFLSWDLYVRQMLGHRGFPRGQFLIAAIQAQAHGEADWAADIQAGGRIMGERRGAVAMVVVAVDIVKETAHVFAQRIIDREE